MMALPSLKASVTAARRQLGKLHPRRIWEKIAWDYIERRTRRGNLKLVLYDPKLDLLRFPEPLEARALVRHDAIADAVPWMVKIEDRLPKGGIYFDVGAFRGITAQWFASRADKVYAFEPMPENAESIRKVLKVRALGNVSVHELAVSDSSGSAKLNVHQVKGHNSLGTVTTSRYLYTITVPTTTLDEFAEQHGIERIDFLKIDVEGFEPEVLRGARRLLAARKIGLMIFEVNKPILASMSKSLRSIYELLSAHSYAVADLDGRALSLSQFEALGSADALAYPGPDELAPHAKPERSRARD